MKGQTELTEFMLKLIATMLFTIFLIGGILAISQFKVQVNENSDKRLAIDFGENVLAAQCLTEKKGLFNETMLDSELAYSSAHPEDKDGISCLKTSTTFLADIKTADREWFYGTDKLKSLRSPQWTLFEFPAAMNDSSGKIVPAKVYVIDYNRFGVKYACNNIYESFSCYNCLDQTSCEKEGCKWETGICKP